MLEKAKPSSSETWTPETLWNGLSYKEWLRENIKINASFLKGEKEKRKKAYNELRNNIDIQRGFIINVLKLINLDNIRDLRGVNLTEISPLEIVDNYTLREINGRPYSPPLEGKDLELYEEGIKINDKNFLEHLSSMLEHVKSLGNISPQVLDIGCAYGDVVKALQELQDPKVNILGIDLQVQDSWKDKPCVMADPHNLSFIEDGSFHIINAPLSFSLEIYISDQGILMKEMYRVLSSGGIVFIPCIGKNKDFIKKVEGIGFQEMSPLSDSTSSYIKLQKN